MCQPILILKNKLRSDLFSTVLPGFLGKTIKKKVNYMRCSPKWFIAKCSVSESNKDKAVNMPPDSNWLPLLECYSATLSMVL